ncbi:M1 family metallopeptidase [uncultured Draconibacterium sp.]|uniref:M1 family metallopeptidase n=1 Tax=uncultured Draconibacterium sp. TaxID=1573823 RepID=UPI0029C94CB4|nr:M1 family metallopeptidase [uncultured Draconibacterium sp.]
MRHRLFIATLLVVLGLNAAAQKTNFTHQDSLRGSITPERVWWDLTYYHLNVKVDPADSTISGSNLIQYRVLESNQLMQIDLQPPMTISRISQNGKSLDYTRDGNAWFVTLEKEQHPNDVNELLVEYSGKPKISKRPPWDGGISWQKDENGNDFIVNTNQGDGGSLWWPCKDHPFDEPDSMLISVTFPDHLMDVSNGRLRGVEQNADGTKTAHWFVNNPINNYGVNINIGNYAHWHEVFKGEKGDLDCDYWVLKQNLEKAKEHFKQAPMMLEAFEHWFGPYPFYEDGYKLVEVPYPGMEHQSSVTYGNGYRNGYGGRDISYSGWGFKFDFIIIHESGHEWFANNITNWDEADMWIHESFTNYSENLFVEYFWGKKAGSEYIRGSRLGILNDRPVIGVYGVNYPGSGDMYPKGANMLHTLRQVVDDDEKWRGILRGLNEEFYHQTVKAEQIEGYLIEHTGLDLNGFFNQYLRDTRIPTFEYAMIDGKLQFRWANCVNNFKLPLKVYINGEPHWLNPSRRWKFFDSDEKVKKVEVDKDFYVAGFQVVDL